MDAGELDMRMKLAELQRQYRETQKELSKLTPKRFDELSPAKRGPGRPRKKGGKSDSPPASPRARAPRPPAPPPPPQPPRWPELKSSRLDALLRPPTLTANKILTSARFRPDATLNGSNVSAGKCGKLTTYELDPNEGGAKTTKSASDKTDKPKTRGETGPEKKSGFPCSRASHTFGSKPPMPGENEPLCWFKTPPGPSRAGDGPPAPPSVPPSSSSKKRKVGRPKKHLSALAVATETIFAKKTASKSKALLVGCLVKSRRLSSSDVPSSFKNSGLYARSPSYVPYRGSTSVEVFSGLERNYPSSFSDKKKKSTTTTEETKSHKILPKLKAEAKVKTRSPGDEDDEDEEGGEEDWVGQKGETALPRPRLIARPAKRGPAPTRGDATRPKLARRSPALPPPPRGGDKGGGGGLGSPGNSESSDDLPLSAFSKKPADCRCLLTERHLETGRLRALTMMGGLLYAGELSPVEPPDVYAIRLDGERGNRPHIQSREEVLRDAILEVRASSLADLPVGARVCAYWSQQYRCLYPGTVAPHSDSDAGSESRQFVSVEFDDGDNGRIGVDDVRLLPADYPITEYDPNPLQSLARRRRRTSGASCDSQSRRPSAEVPAPTATNVRSPAATEEEDKRTDVETTYEGAVKTGEAWDQRNHDATAAVEEGEEGEARSSKERRRLKKRRREKLKRLDCLPPDDERRQRRKKHRCCDEQCRHRRHRRRHRRHRHRRPSRSGDNVSSRLSPVLEQLDILEIQQTAIRQLTNENKMKEGKMKDEVEEKEEQEKEEKEEEEEKEKEEVEEEEKEEKEEEEEKEKEEEPEEEEEQVSSTTNKRTKKKAAAKRDRRGSAESRSKMAAFLPARQLWGWAGRGFKRPGARGRGKKEFYKSIQRGEETIVVGDCAVFLSTGRPDRPYIGRIESMWESWGANMVVRVKWFYHPEETAGCPANLKYPGGLFESPHADENDVQTISHRCEVLPVANYSERVGSDPTRLAATYDNNDVYYQAGRYDPAAGVLTVGEDATL